MGTRRPRVARQRLAPPPGTRRSNPHDQSERSTGRRGRGQRREGEPSDGRAEQPMGSAGGRDQAPRRPMRARKAPAQAVRAAPCGPAEPGRRRRWRRRTAMTRSTPSPSSSTSCATRTCRYRAAAPGARSRSRLRQMAAAAASAPPQLPLGCNGRSHWLRPSRGACGEPRYIAGVSVPPSAAAGLRGASPLVRSAHSFCKAAADWLPAPRRSPPSPRRPLRAGQCGGAARLATRWRPAANQRGRHSRGAGAGGEQPMAGLLPLQQR